MSNEKVNHENFGEILAAFIESEKLKVRNVAKSIGCPEATIGRIICKVTLPTDELLKQGHILMEIGFARYKKLTNAEKEKISEAVGAVGAGGLGVGVSLAAVSASGAVAGLSAAGITSGLAALGGLIGGGMAAGIAVAAAVPVGKLPGQHLIGGW